MLKIHIMRLTIKEEFKALIPPLTDDEFRQLEANILKEGIRDALIVWNGVIIDGHNRYNIAQRHVLDFEIIEKHFESEQDAKVWMIKNQFGRRNLIAYERAKLALELKEVFAEQGVKNMADGGKGGVKSPNLKTATELAKIAGVGDQVIKRVAKIEASATPEIKEKLRRDEISVNKAYQEVKKKDKRIEREKLADAGKEKSVSVDFRLGDFEEVFSDIESGSVDCIITDPPYPKDFLECWSKLSRFANRVLKDGGFCIAYSGQMYLPEVISRMSENLRYYWTFAVYHEGQTQIVNGVNLICRWKPVLIFQKGKGKVTHTIQDYFISESREKKAHDWQQSKSGVMYLINNFTKPGDLICEPFAGGGTTILAAQQAHRGIIAAEINEDTYNIAKEMIWQQEKK